MSRDLNLDGAPQAPGLRVMLGVKPVDDVTCEVVAIRVDVLEAARPLRICVYRDGALLDTWVPAMNGYEFRVPSVRGRHVITARAIDAHGRWGSASALVDH